jgi:hypothetical protein
MARKRAFLALVVVLGIWMLTGSMPAAADPVDITGLWYGNGSVPGLHAGAITLTFSDSPYGLLVQPRIPVLGLVDVYLPAVVVGSSGGTTVTFGVPGLLEMSGLVDGNAITGWLSLIYGGQVYTGAWHAEKDTGEIFLPGEAPGAFCEELPPPYCTGSAVYCSELLPFLPESGPGYLNYPLGGETWEDQFRSYAMRDAIQIIKYATAKVECKSADWDYGTLAPLGLGDMSEADGSIPGTSIGYPAHPPGSHQYGYDVDTAYYQVYAPDNLLRAVGMHYEGYSDAFHLTEPPFGLDVWRTALFAAYLSEHPHMRVIGVDGKIGPILEDALDELVQMGWLDSSLRDSIPLAYEEEDTGLGWFYFHHHHMHLSMRPIYDIVASADLKPETLNRRSKGDYVSVHVELVEGLDAAQIDPSSVALNLDGHTLLYAEPGSAEVSDHNLKVKFDRQAVLASFGSGMVEVTVTGLADGLLFQESITVHVIE